MRLIIRFLGAASVRLVGIVLLIPLVRIALDAGAPPGGIWVIVTLVVLLLPPVLWFLSGRVARWIAGGRWRSGAVVAIATGGLGVVLALEILGAVRSSDVIRLAVFMPIILAAWAGFLVLCMAPGRYRDLLIETPPPPRPAKLRRERPVPAAAPDPLEELLAEDVPDPEPEAAGPERTPGIVFDEPEPSGPTPPPLARDADNQPRDYALASNLRIRPEPKRPTPAIPARVERVASFVILAVIAFGIYAWAIVPFVPTAATAALVGWLSPIFAVLGAGAMLLTGWNNRHGVTRFHISNPRIRRPVLAVVGAVLFWGLAFPIGARGLPWLEAVMTDTTGTSISARVLARGPGKQLLGCSYVLQVRLAEPYNQDPQWICSGNSRLWSGAGPGARIVLVGQETGRGLHYTSVRGG